MYERTVSLVVCVIVSSFAGSVAGAENIKVVAGPMFSKTSDGFMKVWLQTDRPTRMYMECEERKTEASTKTWFKFSGPMFPCEGNSTILSAGLLNLIEGVQPELRVWEGNEKQGEPLIRMAVPEIPDDGKSGTHTIAFGSCAHHGRFSSQPIWKAIVKEKPDCFLFIGDNIYLPNDPRKFPKSREEVVNMYREHYDRNRQVPELQPLLKSTVVYGIWDDHDYGPNNSDRTWKWKDVALQVFQEYFPGEYGLPQARGCFHKFTWGDIDVFMLDDRSFRDPNHDFERKTFLGEQQLEWLKNGLLQSNATFKLVVCGNQMLTDGHVHESWGVLFAEERDAFLRWLWDWKIEGVVFLSGDRHFAELVKKSDPLKKGADLWELTSSPLANRHFHQAGMLPNGDREAIYHKGLNFGLLRFDTTAKPPHVELLAKDEMGETVIHKKLIRSEQTR